MEPDGSPVQDEVERSAAEVGRRIAAQPVLHRTFAVWRSARREPLRPPRKSDIDPVDLARAGVMPFVWIVEKTDAGRFRYRLAGEEIARNFAGGLRGRHVEDLFDPATAAYVSSRFRMIIEQETVEYTCGDVFRDRQRAYFAHRLMLPLLNDDDAPAFALGVAEQIRYDGLADYANPPTYHYDFIGAVPVSRL